MESNQILKILNIIIGTIQIAIGKAIIQKHVGPKL